MTDIQELEPLMTFDEYQAETDRTAGTSGDFQKDLAAILLGLTGEAGEAAEVVKKHIAQGHSLNNVKLAEELGDVAWYLARAARKIGIPLSTIIAGNVAKLRRRYPNGFSTEASIARVDTK